MSKNIFKINYDLLQPLDIVFTHAVNPLAGIIRWGETGNPIDAWNRKLPNHVGLITEDHGQLYLTEVKGKGPEENSMDMYCKRTNFIHSVWRWAVFENNSELVDAGQRYLSMWRRKAQEKGYDLWGAVRSSTWARKLMPWLKPDPSKPFCSESVYDFLWMNDAIFPLEWRDNKPNPLMLYQWFKNHAVWSAVDGWRI